MTDTSMIERVARAIVAELGRQDGHDDPQWIDPDLKVRYLDQGEVDMGKVARAAIEAMRPIETQDVNCALGRAADAKETPMHDLVRSFWQSLIDKALEN